VVQVIGSTSYTGASLTTAIATAQTDISAQATSISNLTSTVGAKGDIYRASSAPSGGTYVSGDLWVDTDDNQLYQWNGSAWASARDAGLATSTALNSVSSTATTANNTANAATANITTLQTTTATLTGDAAAAYVLNVNANGSVAGMVIEANASSSGDNVGSAVQFMADKFAIWNATGSGSGSGAVAPFIVDGGVVYIDMARIKDASITAAKIGSLSANLVNAVNINADSIDSGTLSATRIATTSITTDKLAFGSGTVVTSSGSGANAILTIANNGIILDHISANAIGKVANMVVNNVSRTNSTYTFSSLYYQASTPWSEFVVSGKGGGTTNYLGNSSSPIGSLTLGTSSILESGDFLMMAFIQPYGTIASASSNNESALHVNVYRSTNGSSWSYWSRATTGTRSGGQGFHLSPLVKYAVFDLSSSYHYRFDLWFHLRGFSDVGGSGYGVGEGAISVMRLNKTGGID
jgi:hypothetical protein